MVNTLSREDVIRVIEGKGAAERIPLFYDFYIQGYLWSEHPVYKEFTESPYPRDIHYIHYRMPGLTEGYPDDPDYYWAIPGTRIDESKAHDNRAVIWDWEDREALEQFYATFPDPETPGLLPKGIKTDHRYILGHYWWTYFERLWQLRGMENALMDFYLYPEEVHRLFRHLTDFYIRLMERGKEAYNMDGFQITDDLGAQDRPLFSLQIFREFFKPYYKEIIDKAHALGCHLWMHSCGNIELFLPDLIEIGLDVIHPIQKNTMDEKKIAAQFGDKICILRASMSSICLPSVPRRRFGQKWSIWWRITTARTEGLCSRWAMGIPMTGNWKTSMKCTELHWRFGWKTSGNEKERCLGYRSFFKNV